MKETELPPTQVRELAQAEVIAKKESKIGHIRLQRGQKLFALNLLTQEVSLAKMDTSVFLNGQISHKVIIEDAHLYSPAINQKNAKRKFLQMLRSMNQKKNQKQ